MRTARVLGAGLLAGLVLNIGEAALHGVVFASAAESAMKALQRDVSGTGADTARLVLITFVQGLLGIVLYATVRPKWGSGIATATWVGLILWVLSGLYSAIYLSSGFPGVFSASLIWGPVAFELVLYPLAIAVGSTVYERRVAFAS
jgi:hypothetical protein